MIITKQTSLTDVACIVCTALDRIGITAVLTGGSAATFYAPSSYQSFDIDFVITFRGEKSKGSSVLRELGFQQVADYYKHEDCVFPLEFPPGPLMIGNDFVTKWSTKSKNDNILHVLDPTDCCRDRLAAYLFWNDFSGLEQALAVYESCQNDIDVDRVRAWCKREGQSEKFELFQQRISEMANK